MTIIDPREKFLKNYKSNTIVITKTTKITKNLSDNPFWQSIKMGYDLYHENPRDSHYKHIGMYYSLLNSAYTNRRAVFVLTRNSLRKILKFDKNFKNIITFSNGFSKSSAVKRSSCSYNSFLNFLVKNELVKINEIHVSENKKTKIIEICDADFINYFNNIDVNGQYESCIKFLQNVSIHKNEQKEVAAQRYQPVSNKKTLSRSNVQTQKTQTGAQCQPKTVQKNDTENQDEPHPNDTTNHHTQNNHRSFADEMEKGFEFVDFSKLHDSLREFMYKQLKKFIYDMRHGPKQSEGRRIELKVRDFLDPLWFYGPIIEEETIYRIIDTEFNRRKNPIFDGIRETYKKTVYYVYREYMKEHEKKLERDRIAQLEDQRKLEMMRREQERKIKEEEAKKEQNMPFADQSPQKTIFDTLPKPQPNHNYDEDDDDGWNNNPILKDCLDSIPQIDGFM